MISGEQRELLQGERERRPSSSAQTVARRHACSSSSAHDLCTCSLGRQRPQVQEQRPQLLLAGLVVLRPRAGGFEHELRAAWPRAVALGCPDIARASRRTASRPAPRRPRRRPSFSAAVITPSVSGSKPSPPCIAATNASQLRSPSPLPEGLRDRRSNRARFWTGSGLIRAMEEVRVEILRPRAGRPADREAVRAPATSAVARLCIVGDLQAEAALAVDEEAPARSSPCRSGARTIGCGTAAQLSAPARAGTPRPRAARSRATPGR